MQRSEMHNEADAPSLTGKPLVCRKSYGIIPLKLALPQLIQNICCLQNRLIRVAVAFIVHSYCVADQNNEATYGQ